MIRIAFVLSNLDEDGGQTVVCTLLKNLDKKRYISKLYILSTPVENKLTRQLSESGIKFKFLCKKFDSKMLRTFEILYRLNKEIGEFSPTIINVHLDTLYSWIWALIHKRRIIFTAHSEASRIANTISLKLFSLLNRKELIRVIGVSKFASSSFQEIFHARNLLTIYNPVGICCDKSTERNIHNDIQFINVARFNPVKNHVLLIDAFAIVCQELSNVQLVLVGDGQEFDAINNYVSEKKLSNKVIFAGYREDVTELLLQSDVFVLSSLSEAFPVSVIEALEAGLPIIATEVGGLPEVVTDNGILVENNNANELANAMLLLAKDEKQRRIMEINSLEKAKLFSVEKILSEYEKLFKEEALLNEK